MLRTLTLTCVVALAAALPLACGEKDEDPASVELPSGCEAVEDPIPKVHEAKRPSGPSIRGEDLTAVVETSCGPFSIDLDTDHFAKTTTSFAHLVEEGFYSGTLFSYIDGSVVQGGDPTGDRTGGPGYFIQEAVPFDTEYTRGTVAMAKTAVEPIGRSESQFFVVYAADAGLPPEFAVLGEVSYGMDVIERIARLRDPGSETGAPRAPVVIEEITLEER